MIHKWTPEIYPRAVWVAIPQNEDDLKQLIKEFTFYKVAKGLNEAVETKHAEDRLYELYDSSTIASCYPVKHNDDALGVLLVIYNKGDFSVSATAHEAVHIADYICEELGIWSEDFTDGNEAYAYLVGWAAGKIAESLNLEIYTKNGKRKKV